MFTVSRTGLCFMALLLTASLMQVVQAGGCPLAMLPTDLDLITSVEANAYREVHLHGMYRIGSSVDHWDSVKDSLAHNLTLHYTEDTEFRVSFLPHNAMWMRLDLVDTDKGTIVATSQHGGPYIEHMIFRVLKENVHYTLMVRYSLGFNVAQDCPSTMMELATQPRSKARILSKNVCDGKDSMPANLPTTIRPQSDSAKPYYYDFSTAHAAFAPFGSSSGGDGGNDDGNDDGDDEERRAMEAEGGTPVRFIPLTVHPYKIQVPHIPRRHQKWKFRLTIFSRFLDGGDIAAVLTPVNTTTLPTGDIGRDCVGCMYGRRSIRNEFIVQEELWAGENGVAGEYNLFFVLRKTEDDFGRTCAPFTVHITLHPLKQQETFSNCKYTPLPASLNMPGMYDNRTGVMAWTDNVLVNLTTRFQATTIIPSQKSLLRVWVSNHKALDIDLELNDPQAGSGKSKSLASSLKMEGPEGIVYQLEAGKPYQIGVSIPYPVRKYDGSDNDYYQFCDSFQIHVHVFPLLTNENAENDDGDDDDSAGTSTNDNAACGTHEPNLGAIQAKLNNSHNIRHSPSDTENLPYKASFAATDTVEMKTLFKWEFYVKQESVFSLQINSDNYGGRVHSKLHMKSAAKTIYSDNRGLGTSLFAQLSPGWYVLEVVSPYIQRVGAITFKKYIPAMPLCMRYNFHLRITKFTTATRASDCFYPADMPHDMYLGPHGHRHFTESYQIPTDGTSMLNLYPQKDSVLHFRTMSTSVPLSMYLVRGKSADADKDNKIAHSHDRFKNGHSTMMYTLKGMQRYTVIFHYDMERAAKQVCQELILHQSIARVPADGHFQECGADPGEYHTTPPGHVTKFQLPEHFDLAVGPMIDKIVPPTRADSKVALLDRDLMDFKQPTNFRLRLDYNFLDHDFSMRLCPCSSSSVCETGSNCVTGKPTPTGTEITIDLMPAGKYSAEFYGWRYGLGHGKTDYTRHCTLGALTLAVGSADSKPAPSLCNSMNQYLPQTLNNPSDLYSQYNHEMHYQSQALVPQKNFKDSTKFTLKSESVFRAFLPHSKVPGAIEVTKASDPTGLHRLAWAMGPNSAIYVKLPRGDYVFHVRYWLPESLRSASTCATAPLEFSIMEVSNLPKMIPPAKRENIRTGKTPECVTKPFPRRPEHHGHNTLYRPVGPGFDHKIAFTIGERGGTLAFDVRSGFEAAGLAVSLVAHLATASSPRQTTTIPLHYYSDRVYFDGALKQGTYTFRVWDPVRHYPNATAIRCVPYSLHIIMTDNGNWSSGPVTPNPMLAPTGSGSDTDGEDPPVTSQPGLKCQGWNYETLPEKNITSRRSTQGHRFTLKRQRARIPFDEGRVMSKSFHGHTYKYSKAISGLGFYVTTGMIVRAWVRAPANNLLKLQLFYGSSQEPIAKGQIFGWHTRSMLFHATKSGYMRLEVQFHYDQAPKYGLTYNNCADKYFQTSFEYFVSTFPSAVLSTLTGNCPTDGAAKHRPPTSVVVSKPILYSHDLYFNEDDFIVAKTEKFHMTRPGHNGRSGGGGHNNHANPDLHEMLLQDDDGDDDSPATPPPAPALHKKKAPHLMNRKTSSSNVSISVPSGTSPARIEVQVQYNLLLSNLRISLHGDNQSYALAHSDGGPMESDNEHFNARAMLSAFGLTSGVTYTLSVDEHNAESTLNKNADYCIKYNLRYRITADSYSVATSSPEVAKPHIRDILPASADATLIDPTKHFRVTFMLSDNAAHSVLQRTEDDDGYNGKTLGKLVSLTHGSATITSTVTYFVTSKEVVATFAAYKLNWDTPYTLNVDASALKTADHTKHFTLVGHSRQYHTAKCACTSAGFCHVGGECKCLLPDGGTCDTCGPDGQLRTHHGKHICFLGGTPAPMTLAPAQWSGSTVSTPTPDWTDSPDDDTPAPFNYGPPATQSPDPGENQNTDTPDDNGSHGKAAHSDAPNDTKKPPLRALRVILAAAACGALYLYAIELLFHYRQSRKAGGAFGGNPFRRGGSGSPPRVVTSLNDDEDDDDENAAIVS